MNYLKISNKSTEDDDDTISYREEDENNEVELLEEGDSTNIPLEGSALYPRIYVGDSATPLSGQFNQSEYVDDNITRTWTGILTSYYG
jgi:hypothetical protein